MSDLTNWADVLRRAALPGAARVRFGRSSRDEGREVSYSLHSYDEEGGVIGDEREYDLLKAVFMPLERLAETMEPSFMLEMDLKSGEVTEAVAD